MFFSGLSNPCKPFSFIGANSHYDIQISVDKDREHWDYPQFLHVIKNLNNLKMFHVFKFW